MQFASKLKFKAYQNQIQICLSFQEMSLQLNKHEGERERDIYIEREMEV